MSGSRRGRGGMFGHAISGNVENIFENTKKRSLDEGGEDQQKIKRKKLIDSSGEGAMEIKKSRNTSWRGISNKGRQE